LLDQCDQLQQISDAQVRPSSRRHHERVNCGQARPLCIHATELACLVVVVHAVLTPRQAPVHQREHLPTEWMERVYDPEELRLISQIACS
jgi:hypothetical protein